VNLRPFNLLLLSALLAGCGAARPNKYYQLTVPNDVAVDPPATSVHPVSIIVGTLSASHLYREDHIVYGSSGENMGTYEYQRWAEPPSEMIQDVVTHTLRNSGRFRSVLALRSNVRGDYLLHGHLYEFREITGASMAGRLAIELQLRDTRTGETVWTHQYTHDEPVAASGKNKDVGAVVSALNHNVHRAAAEFASSLDQYFTAHPPAPAPAQ
jgi:cholesterol transport system auxiliary component